MRACMFIALALGMVAVSAHAETPIRISWSLGPLMPQYRKGGVAGGVGGYVIYAGGMQDPWREPDDVLAYDPESKTWEFIAPMPTNPSYTSGTCSGDALYVLGGRNADGRCFRLTRQDERWVWTELPRLQQPRVGAAVAAGDLLIAAGGGWGMKLGGFDATAVSIVEALDLKQIEAGWKTIPHYPGFRRAGAMGAACGGKFYMFGGYRRLERGVTAEDGFVGADRDSPRFTDALRYDPASGAWQRLADLPFGLSCGCAVTYADRYVIIMGGAGHGQTTFTFEGEKIGGYNDKVLVYDTATDRYFILDEPMPAGLNDVKAAIIGDTIYVVGGESVDPRHSNTVNLLQIGKIEMP